MSLRVSAAMMFLVAVCSPGDQGSTPQTTSAVPPRSLSRGHQEMHVVIEPRHEPSDTPLSREQVITGMRKITGRVDACFAQFKSPGLTFVFVTIARDGSVTQASVGGSFLKTPTGNCVEKAVRAATFPPFEGPSVTLYYPFMLR
jgi:hypothetical protein